MKTLHLCGSAVHCGWLRYEVVGTNTTDDIMWMGNRFDTDGLPHDMSETEIERCISLAHWTQLDMNIRLFSQIQFNDYDKVVVWHNDDSNSLLLLYFICCIYSGELYHCRYAETFHRYNSSSLQYETRKVTQEERALFVSTYQSLYNTDGIPKVANGYMIECKSVEWVKGLILEQVSNKAKPYRKVVDKTIAKFPPTYLFYPSYLDCLLFEMVEEGIIMPKNIIKSKKAAYQRFANIMNVPIRTIINKFYAEPIDWNGQMYHRKFYYHGHSIGRWYDFDVVRCEL